MSEANTKPQEKVGAAGGDHFFLQAFFGYFFGHKKVIKKNLLPKKVLRNKAT